MWYLYNNNRIDVAGDENEVWKVAKDIINPNSETEWSMNINNKELKTRRKLPMPLIHIL